MIYNPGRGLVNRI